MLVRLYLKLFTPNDVFDAFIFLRVKFSLYPEQEFHYIVFSPKDYSRVAPISFLIEIVKLFWKAVKLYLII